MQSQSTQKMIDFLEQQMFWKHSVLQGIISDNGPQFTSNVYKKFLEKYGVKARYSAKYHSQKNPAERVNDVIEDCIRVYLKEDQKHWDENIPKIVWAMNSAKHKVTGYTPFFVVHGKEIRSQNEQRAGHRGQRLNARCSRQACRRDLLQQALTRHWL
jgi:hypothetical protein